jgi:hypothetical protein
VANAVLYTTVANVAAIPGSPANNAAIEVTNSTGIESFTPLSGLPAGFIGSSGLSVRIIYQTSGATWTWIQYFPNDPETRYLKLAGGTLTGALVNPLGSAAAPSLTFTGDTNTGIYSPGADQVAVSTGGTGRLFVDSAGKVGVGASPTQLLQLGAFGGNDSNLQFAANTSGASNILFGDGSSGADFYRGLIKYNHATDSLELLASSYSTITTNGSERLRITSAGLVGIGTSSPSTKLEISGNEATANFIVATNTDAFAWSGFRLRNTGTSGRNYDIGLGGNSSGASTAGNFYVYDNTAGAQRITLDSSGRVGIGTTSPGALLHVSGGRTYLGSSDGYELAFARTGNYFYVYNDGGNLSGKLSLTTSAGAGGGEIITFTQDTKRVGIGTSSVSALLHAKGAGGATSGSELLRLETTQATGGNWISFTDASARKGYIGYKETTDDNLYIANEESGHVVIPGTTRLGIGTTSVSELLHLNGASAAIQVQDSGATNSIGKIINASGILYIQSQNNTSHGQIAFRTSDGSATERARIDSSGRLLVGTSTGHGTLQVHDGTFVLSKPASGSERNWRLLPSDAAAGDLAIQQSTTAGGTTYSSKWAIGADGSFSSVIPGGSTLYPRFGCRAWVNFNGSGGGIRASGNVSSVTVNTTGNYTINFSTAMVDANFSVAGLCSVGGADGFLTILATATGSVQVRADEARGDFNPSITCVSIFR